MPEVRGITPGCTGMQYFIQATDSRSITKRVPIGTNMYTVGAMASGVNEITATPYGGDEIANYPNPFSGVTLLRLHVAEKEEVPVMSVTVFDALGREVADLTSALNLSSNDR